MGFTRRRLGFQLDVSEHMFGKKIYIFSKKHLQYLYNQNKYRQVEIPTSKGFLLPVTDAEKLYAIKIIDVVH